MMELRTDIQTFKYSQYKNLIILMFIACSISLLIAVIQTYVLLLFHLIISCYYFLLLFKLSSTIRILRVQDDYFRWWWIWELYWQIVIAVTVVSIAVLWRPSV